MQFSSKFLRRADKLSQRHSGDFRGIPIVVEWPRGSTRVGKDKNGKGWKRKMLCDYGYIDDGSTAVGDHEPLDVYIGPDESSDKVYVVEQLTDDGEFDEYKCMLGFPDLDTAYETYLKHYPDDWDEDRVGGVYEVPFNYVFDEVEEHQQEEKEKTAGNQVNLENYVWASPSRNNDQILKGTGTDHWKFQDSQQTPIPLSKGQYDNMPRGYAEVKNDSKVVILSLSPNVRPDFAFIPDSLVREFQGMFPGYKIYTNTGKTAGIAYLKTLQSMK